MMERIRINAAEPVFGMQLGEVSVKVHDRAVCAGRSIPCCIHNPSAHHMVGWPLNWRSDTGVMERFCVHGCGHPDPDHLAYVYSLTPEHDCVNEYARENHIWLSDEEECRYPHLEWQSIHGCCPERCCASPVE